MHRSEILQAQGDWPAALGEVKKARARLPGSSRAVLGRACYQQAELHRLRGELESANHAYDEAGRNGYEPQPGLSLLRLAEGRTEAAAAMIRGVIASVRATFPRARLLGPCVEILVASGDLVAAREAVEELSRIASTIEAPCLLATSAHARGMILLTESRTTAATTLLREAWALWQQLEMPYDSARAEVLLGRVCERIGDDDTARMHFDAARSVFARLGAATDLAGLDELASTRGAARPGTLTRREVEVLSLVASGATNREIAAELGISEHTVARHLSNIFDRLGVGTRTAASAFAHEHKLVHSVWRGQS